MHYHIRASAISSHVQIFVAGVVCAAPTGLCAVILHPHTPLQVVAPFLAVLWIPSSANSFRTLLTPEQPWFLGGCTVLLGTAKVSSGSPAVLVFSSSHGLVSCKGAGYAPLFLSPPLKLPNLSSTSEPASVRYRTISRDLFICSHFVQALSVTVFDLPLLLPIAPELLWSFKTSNLLL